MSATATGAGLARLLRARRGNVAVEFAMILPALMAILVGGIEFGRLMWTISGLHYSAEEGARCWAVGVCTSSSAAQTQAANAAPEFGFATSNFVATQTTCPGGVSGYQVTATYQFTWVPQSGYMPSTAPNLSATACFP